MKTIKNKSIFTFLWLIALLSSGSIHAELIIIKGKVTNERGEVLTGVTILEKGTTHGTTTNINGDYSITVYNGSILEFYYTGYEKIEKKADKKLLNVTMHTSTVEKDMIIDVAEENVITIGYSKQKRSNLTGGSIVHIQQSSYAEEYASFNENRFIATTEEALSTFSIDVDAASYSNMRRLINNGTLPPADAIRTEELINYFSYNYDYPTGNEPVKISTETGVCPWNNSHRLVRIGIKAKEIEKENLPPSNFVFLIDVSGSMTGYNRLDLVKSSLKLLVNNLRKEDKVAIVTYAGVAGTVLTSTQGNDKQKIIEAIDELIARGSTAGEEGIQLAYKIGKENFIHKGNNRIILCTDGDFNVGVSSVEELETLIEKERKSGIFLTVLGYGMNNYKDNRMQVLAEKGNGNHAYIDNLQEANRVLVEEFGGTIHTVAKDVKLQIEFNPQHVQSYRLIGYESRLLNKRDFNDDTKDAGDIGVGHQVTALYEIVPVGIKSKHSRDVDPLKYQQVRETILNDSKELMTIKLRYKQPNEEVSHKIEVSVIDNKKTNATPDFSFAAAVAMFGQLLTDSEYKGDATFEKVIHLAKKGIDYDEQGYRREFIRLVEATKGLRQKN